jgi:hypothetical protein
MFAKIKQAWDENRVKVNCHLRFLIVNPMLREEETPASTGGMTKQG